LILDRVRFQYVTGIWHGSKPVHLTYMVDYSLDRLQAVVVSCGSAISGCGDELVGAQCKFWDSGHTPTSKVGWKSRPVIATA